MNKPVAWMETYKGKPYDVSLDKSDLNAVGAWHVIEPLYTHSVKELTDEEIEECYWGDGYPDNPRHPKEFARAILRKAQENV